MSRPFLFVTTDVPPDRVGAFRALADRVPIEFALFGGSGLHATAGVDDHGLPARVVRQREVFRLAASGEYAGVVAGTVGRIALPAAAAGARRAGVPFVLWSALWAHPRSPAHLPGSLLLRVLYRRAAMVVTYGPHVSEFAQHHGAKRTVVAPQAVDGAFWSVPQPADVAAAPTLVFVGRDAPGKGVAPLLEAWSRLSPKQRGGASLHLIGVAPATRAGDGVVAHGHQSPEAVRAAIAGASAVVVPSQRTATFREPWGLVVNEAMHAATLVIATDEVGAATGGLVEDGVTGIVVPARDGAALTAALARALSQTGAEQALALAGRRRATSFTYAAWADAFASALTESVA